MRPKRLSGPSALTAAAVTQYTVPAARRALIRQIHVENNTAGPINFTCSVGVDAAGTRLADAKVIPANDFLDLYVYLTLEAAEVFQAFGSVLNALVLTLMGEEELI